MARRLTWTLPVFAVWALGCVDGTSGSPLGAAGSGTMLDDPSQPEPSEPIPASSDAVFNPDVVQRYELTLDAARWTELQANARDEQYVEADLSVGTERLARVGLRFKGGYGTLVLCFDEQGRRTCPKLSMKLEFDEYLPEQRYRGLERLNFNSSVGDPSQLHERLGYHLFREMGIVAPRSAHAELVVNGELLGVFSLVEEVDGRFTDHHFDGGDGNVYKEQWPVTTNRAVLSEALRTNEDAPDHAAMIAFASELAAASPDQLTDVVARYMDLDQLFAYVAVDSAITNWDGITAFYCGDAGCYNHNYFLYQHEGEPRFSLVPWDLDNTFSLAGPLEAVPGALEIPSDCSARLPGIGPMFVAAPACDPLLQGLARADRSRYAAQVARLLEGPLVAQSLETWIDERQALLEPFVEADVYGPGLEGFRGAVAQLRRDLGLIRARAEAERDGVPIERFTLGVDAMNDFESANALGFELGVLASSAPESSFEVTLSSSAALSGGSDMRMAFEFRDGSEPWSQWARLSLPFAGSPVDLRAKSALRLSVRSDRARTLFIGFDSSRYSQPQTGAAYGWEVSVGPATQQIVLELTTATFPVWASAVPETLDDVLGAATALLFDPVAEGRNDLGFLGAGVSDPGEIRIDSIAFDD